MASSQFIFDSQIPNNRIDIYGSIDIKLKMLKPKNERELRVEIEGKNVDHSIINAIRRTILLSIPIYGFHRSNVNVDVERSRNMYNNDLIYNQIEQLPIYDIPNYFDLENPEIYLSNEVLKNLFSSFIPERYTKEETTENGKENDENQDVDPDQYNESDYDRLEPIDKNKKLFKIELNINVKNTKGSDILVSTHDAILKINDKVTNNYQIRPPIGILYLKPDEEISLSAEANLGIAKMSASYEATTNAYHDEITPTKFHLWYETLGQLHQNSIFMKACTILKKKLEYLNEFIKKNYDKDTQYPEIIELELYGEDHTLGNLLSTVLQKCEFIEKAGYAMKHPFIDNVTIAYKLSHKVKKNPFSIFIDCSNYLIKVFHHIYLQMEKIDKQ